MELLETTHPMLWSEYERYQRLNNSREIPNFRSPHTPPRLVLSEYFPRVYWMGVYGVHNALVLQKLGMSLDQMIRPLDIQEISLIGQQILSAVEELHMNSMLHRYIYLLFHPALILTNRIKEISSLAIYLLEIPRIRLQSIISST